MLWKWNVVTDCNDEFNNPTCWSMEINSPVYGKYVWITINPCGSYDIEANYNTEWLKVLFTSKSLQGAKRWVTTNLL